MRILLLSVCGVAVAVPPNQASEIEGLWLVEDGEARIEIGRCEDALCGRVVWLREPLDENGKEREDPENPDPELRGRKIVGLDILTGLSDQPDRQGVYRGGRIYDPKSGKTYRCHVSLGEDGRLKLRGYLGISFLGRTTRWTRIASAESGSSTSRSH